jgi:serine/threonine protein kinase
MPCFPYPSIPQPIQTPVTLTLKIHNTYRCEPTNLVIPQLKPLPDCEGPKLECFIDDITTCDFKLLGLLGGGCHSLVWKAEINGKVYAIKMVSVSFNSPLPFLYFLIIIQFFHLGAHEPSFLMAGLDDDPQDSDEPDPLDDMSQLTIDSLRLHASSFYNECRVFGRLKELGSEDLAIKAYGYLQFYLNDDKVRQHFLPFGDGARRYLAFLGNKDPTDVDVIRRTLQHDDLRIPMMAIVKEWVHPVEGDRTSRESVKRDMGYRPRQLRNLRELHKSGIVIRDLKWQQYLNGQLADFSFAWTIPHIFGPESGLRPRWSFESMAAWDLKCFQEILDDFSREVERLVPRLKRHNLVALRNDNVYESLRPRSRMYGPFLPMLVYDADCQPMKYRPPFDPAKFNWRAVQKTTKNGATGRVTRQRHLKEDR